jgi:Mrp family chromosome partitioning ATPase
MTKIYEALEHAYRERRRQEAYIQESPEPQPEPQPAPLSHPAAPPGVTTQEEMFSLYRSIEYFPGRGTRRLVQFAGTGAGEGTSTIIREFAGFMATAIGKSVLLIDADRIEPSQHVHFGFRAAKGWMDAVKAGRNAGDAIYQVGKSKLFISPPFGGSRSVRADFDSSGLAGYLKQIEGRFELVLVDSPPADVSSDALAIAPNVDGVVLVIEAERTRWTAARDLKERIEKVGGNVFGVVFNKRRRHVPRRIVHLLRARG